VTDLTRNNIAACQVHKQRPEYFFTDELKSGVVVFREDWMSADSTVRRSLTNVLSSCASKAFLACLPENSVPIKLLPHLQKLASELKLTIIAGLEHEVTWLPSSSMNKDYRNGAFIAENKFVVVRADDSEPSFGKKNFPAKVMAHTVLEQIERSRSPEFNFFTIESPVGEVNVWPILCSDFLELSDRFPEEMDKAIRDEKIDLIAVLSHTHRPDTFRNTIERLVAGGQRRPLPINILFTNFAAYGGTFCLAYDERQILRSNATQFWEERIVLHEEESFRLFTDWSSASRAARAAQPS
jgi:hypothetical protein